MSILDIFSQFFSSDEERKAEFAKRRDAEQKSALAGWRGRKQSRVGREIIDHLFGDDDDHAIPPHLDDGFDPMAQTKPRRRSSKQSWPR